MFMHSQCMFLSLFGCMTITKFTQQGLEKLNNLPIKQSNNTYVVPITEKLKH